MGICYTKLVLNLLYNVDVKYSLYVYGVVVLTRQSLCTEEE